MGKKSVRCRQWGIIIPTVIMSVVALVSAIFSILHAQNVTETQFRPYVSIAKITPSLSDDFLDVNAEIENFGILPAYELRVTYTYKIEPSESPETSGKEKKLGCLFHKQKIPFIFTIPKNRLEEDYQLVISYKLYYKRPDSKKEETTSLKCRYYDKEKYTVVIESNAS